MNPAAVVLDLDGVILRTNGVKGPAMVALFASHADDPERRRAIAEYVAIHPGARRDDKIRHILDRILGIRPTPGLVDELLARYARDVAEALAGAALVPGVDAFLAAGGAAFYVSSSAPDAEVALQLRRRGLARHFAGVYGAATPKADALRQVATRHPGARAVFFGDAVSDWEAASATSTAFVGVVSESDSLGALPVVKMVDFSDLAVVRSCMEQSLRLAASSAA